ncbi:jg22199, partial [Pararge aegeria aegeria]
MSAVGMRQDTM